MSDVIIGAGIGAGANILGGLVSNRANKKLMAKQMQMQKSFAQKGIRWRVRDAKAAGIHPLYAMGATTHSYQPIAMSDSLGPALSAAGQDISRAMYQNADAETRAGSKIDALQLENMGLQNDLLRAQIAKLTAQVGPSVPGVQSFPVDSGNILTRDLVQLKPAEVTSARSNDPSVTAGPAGPGFTEFDLGDTLGKWNLPSGDVANSTDDLELLKYAMIVAKNTDKLGRAKNLNLGNLAYQWMNRPEWVDRVARQQGRRSMAPFYGRDGKLYWKPF